MRLKRGSSVNKRVLLTGLVAVSGSAVGAYHLLLSNRDKRKLRVYLSAVARFSSMIKLGVVVAADFKYR